MSGILFRVHTAAGERVDVLAGNPTEARSLAMSKLAAGSIVTKIKVVKGS